MFINLLIMLISNIMHNAFLMLFAYYLLIMLLYAQLIVLNLNYGCYIVFIIIVPSTNYTLFKIKWTYS